MAMVCGGCGREARSGARFCDGCGGSLPVGCDSCGNALRPEARFCDGCGRPIALHSDQPVPAPVPLPGPFAGGRYVVRSLLGEGGRKRVYRAHDVELDRDVALAVLKADGIDGDALARARREAQSMARLGAHRNIVTIYDIGDDDGSPFIVSEYVPGGSLEDELQVALGSPLPIERAVAIASDVAAALAHAHECGLVHRDVKPGNIWLDSTGAARLGDFGLVAVDDGRALTVEGLIIGTVAYMPPEQALGRPAGPRSDLYSLGVVLYEMLTGHTPFIGEDAVSVISQHVNTPPMAPWFHNPAIPRPLGSLVMRLLAKNATDRPASAGEVVAQLESREVVDGGAARLAETRTPQLDRSRLVGRRGEMERLRRWVDAAVAGQGGIALVSGDAGIGKTRLAEEAATYAEMRGATCLVGRCRESSSSPYAAIVEALDAYAASRSTEDLARDLERAGTSVVRLVPGLRRRFPDLVPSSQQDDRAVLFDAVTSLLVDADTPLLVILEDLQSADAPSLMLLVHLASRLAAARVFVICTYRDSEVPRTHPLTDALVELRRERCCERIRLTGLSQDEFIAFLEAMADHPVNEEDRAGLTQVYARTEGNPFFIEEVVRHLLETRVIYWQDGRWRWSGQTLESLPDGVRDVVARRVGRLSDEASRFLTTGAVLGREFEIDVVAAITELPEMSLLEVVDEAVRAHIIEEVAGERPRYAFTQALIRQSLVEELTLPRRQRIHARAAQVIEATSRSVDDSATVNSIAHHLRMAGAAADSERAAEWSIRAGDAAERVFAYESAKEHWEAALALLDGVCASDVLARLLERLGDLMYKTGLDYEAGIGYLERALALYEEIGDVARVAQMHSRLGRDLSTYPDRMDIPAALEHFRKAEEIAAVGPETSALGYLRVSRASAALWGLRVDEAAEPLDAALELAERLGNERLWLHAAAVKAWQLAVSGRPSAGEDLIAQVRARADAVGDPVARFTAVWIAAAIHGVVVDQRSIFEDTRAALDWPEVAEAPTRRTYLLASYNMAAAALGIRDEVAGVNELQRDALLALYEGRWADHARLADEQARTFEARGSRFQVCAQLATAADAHHAAGDLISAVSTLERAIELGEHCGGVMPVAHADLALFLVEEGLLDAGRQHLERAMVGSGAGWGAVNGMVRRAEGAVAAASGEIGTAVGAFADARAVLAEAGLVWELAETERQWALALLAAGDRPAALAHLSEAAEIYRRIGAGAPWIDRIIAVQAEAQGIRNHDSGASIQAVVDLVSTERPDLAPQAAPDGTVTLLFSDIEESTSANVRLGDQKWIDVLRRHTAVVREAVRTHDGYEVKNQGDGFMIAFASARRAVLCAIDIQTRVADEALRSPGDGVKVRIGLHTGEAIKEADDFFGRNVAMAARIAGAANGGEILVSDLLKQLVESSGDIKFGFPRRVELKGIGEAVAHPVDVLAAAR